MEKLDKARDENHLLRVALVENIVELYRYKTALEDIVRTAHENSLVRVLDIANKALDRSPDEEGDEE